MTDTGADPSSARRALESLGVPLSLAEAHGLACGLLCSRSASGAKSRWFAEFLDAAGLAPEALAAHAGSVREVDAWFEATRASLHAAELDFEPALPDDDEPLARRVDALGDFCAGITYGIGLGEAARGNRPLPEDVRELLGDFQAIDAAERGGDDRARAGGPTTTTRPARPITSKRLVEYVRVGVLVMLEEARPVAAGVPGQVAGVPTSAPAGPAVH